MAFQLGARLRWERRRRRSRELKDCVDPAWRVAEDEREMDAVERSCVLALLCRQEGRARMGRGRLGERMDKG